MKTLIMTSALVLSLGASTFASTRTPRINGRQENQQDRIQQGVRSGELTRGEARRLEAQQGRIEANKLLAKSDGYVGPAERRQLTREQNHASREIYRLKHNDRERY